MNYKTAAEIIRRAIGRAGSEDIYDVLTCLGDLNEPARSRYKSHFFFFFLHV